jgi:2,5-diamino-6-(ribosylamino)-4(3H)-pyrimidinone 5'-phosphate reductase
VAHEPARDDSPPDPGAIHVVAHVAVTLDGATTGFEVDVATFYRLAASWSEDLTLTGADTILVQEPALLATPGPGPAADGPLLAVVDSRARVSCWDALRAAGYWRDVVAVRATDAPPGGRNVAVDRVVAGTGRVDLGAALSQLQLRYGVRTVRVDSGGGLLGALMDAELIDELSLLIHPLVLVDGAPARWWANASRSSRWSVTSFEALDELVWLRLRCADPT